MSDSSPEVESLPKESWSENGGPFNPFAEMCDKQFQPKSGNGANKSNWDSHQSWWQYDQSQNDWQSTWQSVCSAQPPPSPFPPPWSHAKDSNPQEDPQMQQEMSWDVGNNCTPAELDQ
eukprot:7526098-Karenia_brevis.AAC.1